MCLYVTVCMHGYSLAWRVAFVHTYMHTYIHTYIHIQVQHPHILAKEHTYMHATAPEASRHRKNRTANMLIYIHTYTYTTAPWEQRGHDKLVVMYTYIHAYMHTYIHTYIHIYNCSMGTEGA